MRKSVEFGGSTAYLLTPDDASPTFAKDVADVTLAAYVARFPDVAPEFIAEQLKSDPDNPDHVEETFDQLLKGPENAGWYWAVGMRRELGVRAVGYVLTAAGTDKLTLLELHTHPDAQRRRMATVLARASIGYALADARYGYTNDTPIGLAVIRRAPDDDTEHPARFYRSIGFVDAGEGNTMLGLPTQRMVAPVGEVLENLDVRLRSE